MKTSTSKCGLALVCATLLLVLSFPAVAGKPTKPGGGGGGGGTDPCVGATPSFVFSKSPGAGGQRDVYLADESGACQRYLFSVSAGNYERYVSFRVASGEGIAITTDGGDTLLLARFPIGTDMQVDAASVDVGPIFDSAQDGYIDVTNFELAADGRRLAYVTTDEDGGNTWLFRLRVIADVADCPSAGCSYDAGDLLAESIGLCCGLMSPRWDSTGSMIYVEDYRGVGDSPYISRVPASVPSAGLHSPEIVIDGPKLRLFELRAGNGMELLAYGSPAGSGCRDVRVVDVSSANCVNGSCPQVNNESPRVLVSRLATIQSVTDSAITILADGGKEGRKGGCSVTDTITRAVDSSVGVQISTLANGKMPAAR